MYSFAARYRAAQHVANGPSHFFGGVAHPAAGLLPTCVSAGLASIPEYENTNIDEFLRHHTALPLFFPIISPERAARAVEAARIGGSIHLILGTAPNGPFESEHPRLCPACVANDIRTYGFAYWHREHQLKCTLICARHGIPLRQSTTPGKRLLCSPSYDTVPALCRTSPVSLPPDPAHVLRPVARDILSLLTERLPVVGMEHVHACLHDILLRAGYGRLDGSIKITRLSADVTRHFGSPLLVAVGCELRGAVHSNWIAQLVRRPRAVPSPIKILLLARFLGTNVCRLIHDASSVRPRRRRKARPHPHRIRSPDRLVTMLPHKRSDWLKLHHRCDPQLKRRLYAWLWRNSRSWLMHHKHGAPRHANQRRNWPKIDRRLSRIIRQSVVQTKDRWPPVRASRHRIASQTRYAHYLLTNDIRRFPQAVAALRSCHESAVEYSVRKLRTTMLLRPELRAAPRWRILTAAGIGATQAKRSQVRRVLAALTSR